ncbi:hypothetical protein [Kitasatospora aureofaciens]|uniref:hypothetical protein n=1 Tax=Kitasatospora aureofaciens TaxID=1894 RepID=UPI0036F4A57E
MTSTENGWGWVYGRGGEHTRRYLPGTTVPPETAQEALSEVAWRLGLPHADVEQILDRIDRLRSDHRTALRAVAAARHGARSAGT